MTETLGYEKGFPDWREAHGHKAGLALGAPLGLIVACPPGETRAELQARWEDKEGSESWYGVTFQTPEGFVGKDADWCVCVQAHEDGVAKPPPWSLVLKTNGLRLEMRHKDGTRETLNLGPLPLEPTRIVVHIISTVTNTGLIEVWRDGIRVGAIKGSTRYTTKYPVRPRVGAYRGHTAGKQIVWFGPLSRGESLEDVLGEGKDCSEQQRAVEETKAIFDAKMSALLTAEEELHHAQGLLDMAYSELARCQEE